VVGIRLLKRLRSFLGVVGSAVAEHENRPEGEGREGKNGGKVV
jgi:hypothetical protein